MTRNDVTTNLPVAFGFPLEHWVTMTHRNVVIGVFGGHRHHLFITEHHSGYILIRKCDYHLCSKGNSLEICSQHLNVRWENLLQVQLLTHFQRLTLWLGYVH